MADIIPHERPDGSRISVDRDWCIEHRLSDDGVHKRILYHRPDDDLWIYRVMVRVARTRSATIGSIAPKRSSMSAGL